MVYICIVLIHGEIYPLRWNCQVAASTLAFSLRGHSIFFQAGMASEGCSFVRIDSFVWAPVLCPSGGIDICCTHGPENSFGHRCVTPATDCYIYMCVYTRIYTYVCCHLNEVRSHLSMFFLAINKTKSNCHPQQL